MTTGKKKEGNNAIQRQSLSHMWEPVNISTTVNINVEFNFQINNF